MAVEMNIDAMKELIEARIYTCRLDVQENYGKIEAYREMLRDIDKFKI